MTADVHAAQIAQLAAQVVASSATSGRTVATAESCTGGWIAKALTDVPGSSACLGYGLVTYSNGAKEAMLGVESQTLDEHGAVSEAVVREMAAGAVRLSGAELAVAVSGVAGPEGGTESKPVGTVWFAWANRDGTDIATDTLQQRFSGDREAVRGQAVVCALQGLLRHLSRD